MNRKNNLNQRRSCEALEPLLSDFADGELDVAAAAALEEHLESCRRCRMQVAMLRRSLAIARSIWQESAESTERAAPRSAVSRRPVSSIAHRRSMGLPLTAAVVIALAIVTCWAWYGSRPQGVADRAAARADRQESHVEVDGRHDPQVAASLALDDESIDALIRREEQAARLAMAIEIMASVPELESDVARAREYLESTYGSESLNTQPNHPPFTEGS